MVAPNCEHAKVFEVLISTLIFTGLCLAIAAGVWQVTRKRLDVDPNERGDLLAHDWFTIAINVGFGMPLGIVLFHFGQLLTSELWPFALLLVLVMGGLLLFDRVGTWLLEKVFPSGIRPARNPSAQRRVPLPRRLSLPLGIVLGVVLAQLGVGAEVLRLLA